MPLPVINYAELQPQGSPTFQNLLPSIQQGIELAYVPKNLKAQLISKTLENQFAPALKSANINQLLSKANLENTQSITNPIKAIANLVNADTNSTRFNSSNNFRMNYDALTEKQKTLYAGLHPDIVYGMLNAPLQNNNNSSTDLVHSIIPHAIKQLFPNYQTQNQNPSIENDNNQNNLPPVPKELPLSQDEIDKLKKFALANQIQVNKNETPIQQQDQASYSRNFLQFLDSNQERYSSAIKSLSKYTGLSGAIKLQADRMKSIAGFDTPQEYKDYVWFTDSFIPIFALNSLLSEGGHATNVQKHTMENILLGPLHNTALDPESFINVYNKIYNDQRSLAQVRIKNSQPIFKDTSEQAYGKSDLQNNYIQSNNKHKVSKRLANRYKANSQDLSDLLDE